MTGGLFLVYGLGIISTERISTSLSGETSHDLFTGRESTIASGGLSSHSHSTALALTYLLWTPLLGDGHRLGEVELVHNPPLMIEDDQPGRHCPVEPEVGDLNADAELRGGDVRAAQQLLTGVAVGVGVVGAWKATGLLN